MSFLTAILAPKIIEYLERQILAATPEMQDILFKELKFIIATIHDLIVDKFGHHSDKEQVHAAKEGH